MKLDEVLDYVAPYEWIEVQPDYGRAMFTVGDKKYSVTFDFCRADRYGGLPDRWDIEFALLKQVNGITVSDVKITGTGDQFKVFSAVVAIAKQWLIRNPTNCVTMSAEEPSRQKLYLTLLHKLLPGWDIQTNDTIIIALDNKARIF